MSCFMIGEGYSIGFRSDGSVVYAGNDFSGDGRRISEWTEIKKIEITGEENYVIGYKKDGSIHLETLFDWESYQYGTQQWRETDFST